MNVLYMGAYKKQIRQMLHMLVLSVLVLAGLVPTANAAQSSSSGYQVNEVFFGNGGELHACSTNYCSKQAAGETTVGNTSSANYQAQAGFNSDRVPSLTFIVPSLNIDFGVLTPGTTARATSTFSVYSYLTSGYVVQTVGDPPSNAGRKLNALTTATASNSSAEQFGINAVANTSPATFGANPIQLPDNTFSNGSAASGYNTANVYKYNNGDVIAQSLASSGTTNFTLSYIINTTAVTPGGTYRMNQILVATSAF